MKVTILKIFFSIICILVAFQTYAQETNAWDLNKCINYALKHNITISQSYLREKSAKLTYDQSKWERLPNLYGSASQTFSNNSDVTNVGLQSEMTLFNGNKINYTIHQNKLITEQKAIEIEESKNSIELAITEAYIQSLYYKENITLAKKVLESSLQEFEQSKTKYDLGTISIKEYSDMESQYAKNEYSVIKAENLYNQQILTLKQLLELPPETSFTIVTPNVSIDSISIPNTEQVYTSACKILPEVQRSLYQSKIDSLDISIAKANYYPSLSLSSGISSNISDYHINVYDQLNDNIYSSLRLQLTVPIFYKFERKTQVELAKINAQNNVYEIESTKKNLYKKIENAYLNATSSYAEVLSLQKVEIAAAKSYELTREQFNYGATNSTNLLLAQTNYINAGISLVQAKYMTLLYYQLLQFYQGNPIRF